MYADVAVAHVLMPHDTDVNRPGVDVSMPLFAMVEYSREDRRRLPEDRGYLLTFRGTRSKRADQMRRQLWKIHNGVDIIVPCACRFFGSPLHRPRKQKKKKKNKNAGVESENLLQSEQLRRQGYDERCAEDEAEFQKYNYTDLAKKTKFSLIVEGFGLHSFRLTEAMGAGSIPVILIDHYVLPFDMLLDWGTFSIRLPESKLEELPTILKAIPADKVVTMQKEVVRVYEAHFSSLAHQVYSAVEQVRLELFTPKGQVSGGVSRDAGDEGGAGGGGGGSGRYWYEEELRMVRERGLPHQVSPLHAVTPAAVQNDSVVCNTQPFRRSVVKDGAVMR